MWSRGAKLERCDTSSIKGLACRPFRGQDTTPHNDALRIIREDAEQIEERLASRGRGVDRLLGRLQLDALFLQFMRDFLQVLERPRQPVDPRNYRGYQGVITVEKIEHRLQLGRPSRRVPEAFSARMTPQPAAFRASRWSPTSWSIVLTRA
jgi:hypothetical protein